MESGEFYIKGADETVDGPLTAKQLRAREVQRQDQVRFGDDGPWLSFAELVVQNPAARESLDEAVDPDEPALEKWQKWPVINHSWVTLIFAADALWVGRAASLQLSAAGFITASALIGSLGLAAAGLLARKPWAWPLSALVSFVMSLWMLAPFVASQSVGWGVWLTLNLLTCLFLALRRPKGKALDWPQPLRRFLLVFYVDADSDRSEWAERQGGNGPAAAISGFFAFLILALVGMAIYHWVRFPDRSYPIGLGPQGAADTTARLASLAVYLSMVVLAWFFARWGRPAHRALGMTLRQGLPRILWTGARVFVMLFLVLMAGRFALRTVEAFETTMAQTDGGDTAEVPTAAGEIREAVRGELDRAPRRAAFSPWVLLITLLVGPLCEEIFFRGLIFGSLRRRWPFWAAAGLSCVLFAAAHWFRFDWSPATAFLLFEVAAGGLATAYAYELTGSLLAPICLHVLWNGMQTAAGMAPGG